MLNDKQAKRFCALRREAIAREFSYLNPEQREGVLTTEGPLLLLAGAGSGKTTVLINRIANLIKYGCGSDSSDVPDYITDDDLDFMESFPDNPDEMQIRRKENLCRLRPAAPWTIIAITFTNKAAGEIKERLEKVLGPQALDIWAATFHSACVRILRRHIDRIGFSNNFTIYDSDDSLRVIKEVVKALELDEKLYNPRSVLSVISSAKDKLKLARDFEREADRSGDFRMIKIAQIYLEYERRLWEADALDFDDIILHTVRLLQSDDEVRAYWQNKFRYVLIDEYQDTNHIQYLLAALLAGKWENICVVGDDDQSIYRFRGATIENILSFEDQYKGTRVIRLEQNYRSTEHILAAANAVIQNNYGRKGKNLWTQRKGGELISVYTAMNEHDEAQYVASQIIAQVSRGAKWKEFAILYRMNAQSNQLEYAFKRNGIPYVVYGGTKFFDRAEVKDMLAYLCVIHNTADDLRLKRIINTPARGIGARTIELAEEIAQRDHLSLYEVILHADRYPELTKSAAKLGKFTALIEDLRSKLAGESVDLLQFYDEVVAASGYVTALEQKNTVENRTRIENVQELKSSIQGYLENAEVPSLAGFLDEVSLYTDLDSRNPDEPCVTMMTIHASKGLEFEQVFIVGMEETIFPSTRAIGEQDEMEEERRLCYVAITRAKSNLYLTCANQRMLFGRTNANRMSRFVSEIPNQYLSKSGRNRYDEDREYGGRWGSAPSFDSTQERKTSGREGYTNRQSPYGGSSIGSRSGSPSVSRGAVSISIQKGEMVYHDAFGKGMVISITKMGGDALVEIAFDNVGTKRLMYKSASSHLKKL